jgi:hypothetical protein
MFLQPNSSLDVAPQNDQMEPIIMRLACTLAAAAVLGASVPATAQTISVGVGYGGWWGGPAYEYSGWGGPSYAYGGWYGGPYHGWYGGPRAQVYVYDTAPRYRYRRYSRSWNGAYGAYAYGGGPYVSYGRSWGGPHVSVGFGGWGPSYAYRSYGYRGGWGW